MHFEIGSGACVPPGFYRATFEGVAETEPHPEFGRGVKFTWRVTGGDHDGSIVSSICGLEKPPTPKNRLGRTLGGLLGSPVVPGARVDCSQFHGRTYMIAVEQAPNGTGTRVGTIVLA
jgi:hypothetical protein